MMAVRMWRLLTFGGLALESEGGSPLRLRPQRLAILAVLAASDRGVSRERMYSIFWPEADEERARHSLRQALYALRQELGDDVVQMETVLQLDRARLGSDVADFRGALQAGDLSRAARLATGPFLDGFFLPGGEGFERWVEDERARLAADTNRVLLALAKESEARGDLDTAVDWWRRLTRLDPLSSRYALGFLKSLAASGDRAGALAFAREHESVVRRELETDPDPEILQLEAELRAIPSPRVIRSAPPPSSPPARQSGTATLTGDGGTPNAVLVPGRVGGRRLLIGVAAAIGAVATAAFLASDRWRGDSADQTFAVGLIREDGVPDTLRIGGVLTDMLATNLARVAGLSVLSNTRLLELMRPGQDTQAVGYVEAARRAGATEILQGRLLAGPQWSLALEIQRVEVATGIVRGAYRVQASDRYAIVDSMTAHVARDLRLRSPAGSVAEATTASPVAYRLYEEGLRALHQYDVAAALRLFRAALEEDSTFAMAAYYDAILQPGDAPSESARYGRALRLANRLPDRERLIATAQLLMNVNNPAALAVAESLSLKFPGEPQSYEQLSKAYASRGDWAEARNAIERAIAIDSASEPVERQSCRLCEDLTQLSGIYFWWDSLDAAERTAQRYLRLRPWNHNPRQILVMTAALRGDSAATHANLRKFQEVHPYGVGYGYFASRLILAGDYEGAEHRLRTMLDSPRRQDVAEARGLRVMLLRNQGRLAEARRQVGEDSPHNIVGGVVALEQADYGSALSTFGTRAGWDYQGWPVGTAARHRTWSTTLLAMVLVASGDTSRLRQLADTVEYWGQRSNYGRDRRAHHYVRGMLLVAQKRDIEAAAELRAAIHSPTNGFTRVNYELGRTLLRLGRPDEAVPVVRAALHGELDGSSLYMSRTVLHELLAQAFDQSGVSDSAAAHYRAVVKAWANADPMFQARRDSARSWLARHGLPR
jgi:DNA-binding SARP family transcriptional activator/tetratricopeptide (TPR) repeat protein